MYTSETVNLPLQPLTNDAFIIEVNPLQSGVAYLYLLKTSVFKTPTSKLQRFSDIFRGCRKAALGCNGLKWM